MSFIDVLPTISFFLAITILVMCFSKPLTTFLKWSENILEKFFENLFKVIGVIIIAVLVFWLASSIMGAMGLVPALIIVNTYIILRAIEKKK